MKIWVSISCVAIVIVAAAGSRAQEPIFDPEPAWIKPPNPEAEVPNGTGFFADIDRDGDLDMGLSAGSFNAHLNLYFNDPLDINFGGIGFTTRVYTRSYDGGAADVNGDGYPDVLVSGRGNTSPRVVLFLNRAGELEVNPEWNSSLYTGNTEIELGDMDGDGDLDLVMARDNDVWSSESQGNRIYLNEGGPNAFAEVPIWISRANEPTSDVALGDLDSDGDIDVVFGNRRALGESGSVSLYMNLTSENSGSILDSIPDARLAIDRILSLAIGDVDGDGDFDLVCGREGRCSLHLNRFDEGPPWNVTVFDETPTWQFDNASTEAYVDMVLFDADLDGDLDLACATGVNGLARLFLNTNGPSVFGDSPDWEFGEGQIVDELRPGDPDNDGDFDLLSVNDDFNTPSRIYRNISPVFESPSLKPMIFARATRDVAIGDVNGDGRLDLVFAHDGQSLLYFNFPTLPGNFAPAPQWSNQFTADTRAVALADVDQDGTLDLVCGNYGEANTIFLNTGSTLGVFESWSSESVVRTTSVAVADLDGDGFPEIAFGNEGSDNHVYRYEFGEYNRFPTWISGGVRDTRSVLFRDLDGDGDPDLVCGNAGSRNQVFLNEGGTLETDASWESRRIDDTWSIAAGDVNGDGINDLICGNNGEGTTLYINADGNLPLDPAWTSPPDSTRSVTLHDVDGDGDLDLLCVNHNSPDALYLNTGGIFTDEPVWTAPDAGSGTCAVIGDVDDDGDMDAVIGNETQATELFLARRNPVLSFDPQFPANHLPQNPTEIRNVSISESGANTVRVDFEAVDVESDPLWLVPRFRYEDESVWRTCEGILPAGPAETDPLGADNRIDWDVSRIEFDQRDVVLGLYAVSMPNSVGAPRMISSFHKNIGPLDIRRSQVEAQPDVVEFSGVTYGDTVGAGIKLANTGNEDLIISDVVLPSNEMWVAGPVSFVVLPGQVHDLDVNLGPRTEADISGHIEVVSNAPLSPVLTLAIQTEIRTLTVDTRALLEGELAPLGEALTVHVIPDAEVAIERAELHYRPADGSTDFTSVEMVHQGGSFIGVIPGADITESGLCYYVELENSGVFATDPPADAPDSVYCLAVESAVDMVVAPVSGGEAGFLAERPVRVEVQLPQGTVFQHGSLHYRVGGGELFESLDLDLDGGVPGATIPAGVAGPRGLEYWVGVRTAGDTLTSPRGDPVERPYTIPVTVQDLAEPIAYPAFQYRMMSIPLRFGEDFTGTLESMLADQPEFGPYGTSDPAQSNWRCFRWSPGLARYAELSEAGYESEFLPEPGRGFWLVNRNSNRVSTSPITGFSTPTDSAYAIVLEPGYNQIGHPFNFPVSWDRVQVDGQVMAEAEGIVVEPLVSWTGSSYRFDERTLEPFAGYWVNNLSTGQVTLQIPARETPPEPEPAVKARDGWRVVIKASCEGAHDEYNVIGVSAEARESWDRNDRTEPPASPGRSLSLYFPHANWAGKSGRYTADLREPDPVDGGHAWSFDVAKSFAEGQITLEFEGLPSEWSARLIDRELLRTMELEPITNYRFNQGRRAPVTDEADARFLLLVGTEAFLAEYDDDLPDQPAMTALYQNRPNPFNPMTVIRYDIAQPGNVSLRIYDVSGALVKDLVAEHRGPGRYEEVWSGLDDRGQRAATGMYFYRLVTGAMTETKKMLIVK